MITYIINEDKSINLTVSKKEEWMFLRYKLLFYFDLYNQYFLNDKRFIPDLNIAFFDHLDMRLDELRQADKLLDNTPEYHIDKEKFAEELASFDE